MKQWVSLSLDLSKYEYAKYTGARNFQINDKVILEKGDIFCYRTHDKIDFYYVVVPDLGPKETKVSLVMMARLGKKSDPCQKSAVERAMNIQGKEKISPKLKALVVDPAVKNVDKGKVAEESALDKMIGDHITFAKTSHKANMLPYLRKVYANANRKFFDGKLKPCGIYIMKDMGKSFRGRGKWIPSKRTIGISPRLFNGEEIHVLTTLVHEMCHQATSEIDGIAREENGGHGYNWVKWMRKCGLTASRYSIFDNETFMTDTELEEETRKKQNKEKAVTQATKTGMKQMYYLREDTVAQYFDAKANKWIKGLIVSKNDQKGERWVFIVTPTYSSWKIIPATWFFEVPKEEQHPYLATAWLESAKRIREYQEKKKVQRSNRKVMRSMDPLRYILGM